ncbi:MAG: hypothetical protein E5W41_00040 [Mesorhizobium sp.]|nr:MAG: hypothetical protein E5W41_00040 [Mesorhizobium sp.]
MSIQPIRALALVDDDNGISLSHLFTACQRSVWQKELDDLAAKLAQKGATHTVRIVDVTIAPAEVSDGMLSALKEVVRLHDKPLPIDQHRDPEKLWVIMQLMADAARAAIAMAEVQP